MFRLFAVLAAVALLTKAAPNVCRDTAACCQIFNFESATWPAPVNSVQFADYQVLPWSDRGIALTVDQMVGTPAVPAPLGLVNISKAGVGSLITGASWLQQTAAMQDGMVLTAFNAYPSAMLAKAQTLRIRVQKQPACIAHVRTLRSVNFANRESVRLTESRLAVPGDWSSALVVANVTGTAWAFGDTRIDNDYELYTLAVDELKVEFYGLGYGAVASIEVCYSAPQGFDACGVCGGSASTCSSLPGAPCDTGLGTTALSGDCSAGTVDSNLQCIPDRANNVELCNGLDDNCNGLVDEGDWGVVSCGIGACARTFSKCMNGQPNDRCVPLDPTPEVCDGIDNDCNGLIDEGGVCNSPSQTRAPLPSASTTSSNTPSPTPSATNTPTPSSSSPPTPSSSPLPAGGQTF